MRYIIDTNVPIVANGTNTNASPDCRLSTIDFLETMMMRGRLVVDLEGEIESEYRSNLSEGQPGVGNRFIQTFFTAAVNRIERIEIGPKKNGEYPDFPKDARLKNFDKSDRKFVALARKGRAPIANAVDSDWVQFKEPLENNKISVRFLCGTDQRKWTAP